MNTVYFLQDKKNQCTKAYYINEKQTIRKRNQIIPFTSI